MAFIIYPDEATAALLGKPADAPIALAANEAMAAFVPLAGLVGPDPSAQGLPTTFVRIALSGPPVPDALQPRIELIAHDPRSGSAAAVIDPGTATSPASGVALSDDLHAQAAALAYFVPPYVDNVYLLKVLIEIPGTSLWMRITNTTGAARQVVWVVADGDADTLQPWVHVTFANKVPADVKFGAMVGQTASSPIEVTNRGTGACTVGGVVPAVAKPFTISGLPLTLAANPPRPAKVTVGFVAPDTPGDFGPSTFGLTVDNKPDPGPFGAGHNNQFAVSAHTQAWPVIDEFDPAGGRPGDTFSILGSNLIPDDGRGFSILFERHGFGSPGAHIVGSPTSKRVSGVVPEEVSDGRYSVRLVWDGGAVDAAGDFDVNLL